MSKFITSVVAASTVADAVLVKKATVDWTNSASDLDYCDAYFNRVQDPRMIAMAYMSGIINPLTREEAEILAAKDEECDKIRKAAEAEAPKTVPLME